MVNNVSIAPFRSVRARPISIVECTGSQEQIIDFIRTQLGEGLLNEYLHTAQILQVKWQNMNGVLGGVEGERVVRSLGSLRVSGTDDETVRLGLFKQLLDCFKSLPVILD